VARTTPWPTEPRTVFFDDVASAPTLVKAASAGKIRRLAPRVYTADLAHPPEELIRRNWQRIVAHLVPQAVIVDRSAAHFETIASDGLLTIAADTTRQRINLPGLEIRIRLAQPQPTDTSLGSGLALSSNARIVLDNLRITRGHGHKKPSTLSLSELEDWLASKAIAWGDERMERLRLETLELAEDFYGAEHLEKAKLLFSQLQGQAPLRQETGSLLKALRQNEAWDAKALDLFKTAAQTIPENLQAEAASFWPAPKPDTELPLYESYFSNFIEGTEFAIPEARAIIDSQTPPEERPQDGHDILGTYHCATDALLRGNTSNDIDTLIALLRERHRIVMQGRPEMRPGEWKLLRNQVGPYVFVDPKLLEGTLYKGLELLTGLEAGIQRALFLLVVVCEVHPFADGNGRVARLMMNAELSSVGACRIVIPNVSRTEYISGLQRVSANKGDTRALVRVMNFAWRWTALMPWGDPGATETMLDATNALLDPIEALESGKRLELP